MKLILHSCQHFYQNTLAVPFLPTTAFSNFSNPKSLPSSQFLLLFLLLVSGCFSSSSVRFYHALKPAFTQLCQGLENDNSEHQVKYNLSLFTRFPLSACPALGLLMELPFPYNRRSRASSQIRGEPLTAADTAPDIADKQTRRGYQFHLRPKRRSITK